MLNIVAVVGSNNQNSITKRIIEQIFSAFDKAEQYNTEIIFLQENDLKYCLGCNRCFYEMECVLDKEDTLGLIKKKLHQADCVVFASPVYLNGCSGLMKTFIDRLAYQTHLMSYSGKLSFNIITTAQSGSQIVGDYFNVVQCHLGMKNLGTYVYKAIDNDYEKFISYATAEIKRNIERNFGWSTVKLENQFKTYYNLYNNTRYGSKKEKDYWNQNWVKNCKSFQEYAVLMRKNKKRGREACNSTKLIPNN